MGLEQFAQFSTYHRVLNHMVQPLAVAPPVLLVDTFVPTDDPVVIGLDALSSAVAGGGDGSA
jgi:hypothetical protein